MDRRQALTALGGLGLAATVRGEPADGRSLLLAYLEGHRRADGGYGWPDLEESHLTPTWAVIGCYHLLDAKPPRAEELAAFVRGAHPQEGKKPEYNLRFFDYQQLQSLVWLGQSVDGYRQRAAQWSALTRYPPQYEPSGLAPLQHEMAKIQCRALAGLPPGEVAEPLLATLRLRRRANGSFNHSPAADGSDGHVLNTWWGLWAWTTLGWPLADQAATIAWLRGCQRPNGGCTYGPTATIGAVDDVAYTWAAVQSLRLLGGKLADEAGCLAYLASLRCADGGFGDRPGWPSNPVATWYAVSTLAALAALDRLPASPAPSTPVALDMPTGPRVFRAQIQAPGNGSPADAVNLARGLGIDLWLAKNAEPRWLAHTADLAARSGVATRFAVANEEYGTFFSLPGLGSYSHLADPMAPDADHLGRPMAGQTGLDWPTFRDGRLGSLAAAGGRMVWQYVESEEFARVVLDDDRAPGYAAIATHHFGNPDFLVNQPFLYRWRHRLPLVSLQDAHGGEGWWWRDNLAGFVTLFVAREGTWDGWLEALAANRVAAARRDDLTGGRLRLYGGAPGLLPWLRDRQADWQPTSPPWASLVAIGPSDSLESPKPERGVTLRLRLWHQCARNGTPQRPLVRLVALTVDGRAVAPREELRPADPRLLAELPDLPAGGHEAVAELELLADQSRRTERLKFRV